jgi:hypothetical protein
MEPQLPVNSPFTVQPGAATPSPVSSPTPSAPKPSMTHHLIFSLIGLAVAALAAGAVYYFENNKVTDLTNQLNTAKTSLAAANKKLAGSATSTSTATTTKLATATLKDEKLSFSYPTTWKLTNTSQASTDPGANQDTATMTSPDGFVVSLNAGLDGIGGACPDCVLSLSKIITSMGQQMRENFISSTGDAKSFNGIDLTLLSAPDCTFECSVTTKNITFQGNGLAMLISAGPADGATPIKIADIATNADVVAAEAIFASLHY